MPETKPDETTRTQKQDDTDALESTGTGGTPADDERNARDGDEANQKALNLAQKQTIENLTRQLDDVNAQLAHGSQPATGAEQRMQTEMADRDVMIAELRRLAPVDPVARAALVQQEEFQSMRQDTMDAFTLAKLPEEKQGPMLKFYNNNRHHFASLSDCARYVKGREAETEVGKLRKELEDMKAKGAKGETDEDTVRTSGRDVNQATHKATTISREAFDQKQRELKEAGDFDGARAMQNRLLKKELVLKG